MLGLTTRWKMMLTAVATVLALALPAATGMGAAHAGSAAVADDGQVTPKFTTGGAIQGIRTADSVPYWSSSFSYKGVTYPFTMVGSNPSTNGTTTIPTVLIPVKFLFSPASNLGGGNFSDVRDPYSVDPGTGETSVQGTLNSPIFKNATYPLGVGTTQFGDAIQRATFNKTGSNGYHVLLGQPTVLPEVTVTVPANQADVHRISARIDYGWFSNQINQILNSLQLGTHVLPIVVTYDTYLYLGNDPANCCVAGYHAEAAPNCPKLCSGSGNGAQPIQTMIYEAWTSPGIFLNPSFVDALPLSHEVSEWLNDPFIYNIVPNWVALGPAPFCQSNLETGDVLEELHNAAFPITLKGITYHVQTEAILPWFERQSPSTSVGGAYSYPDTTLAPTVAADC